MSRKSKNQIRQKLVKRDGPVCRICGKMWPSTPPKTEATIDHIVPRALGGSDRLDNLQLACKSCNHYKGAKLPDEYEARYKQG